MFPEHTLEEIRTRIDLVELVSEYVTLKKSGQGFSGLCPFHGEKTPSFHVHPMKQIFHCFGCHKGGNAFSFYSSIEGLNFPQTVRRLADRVGVRLPDKNEFKPAKKAAPPPQSQRLMEALDWAARYFHHLLMNVSQYRGVQQYLKKRGLSAKSVRKFNLGVSPKGWGNLRDAMIKRGFKTEELIAAGLASPSPHAGQPPYDKFRNRLMFPIRNLEGQIVGFGARLLEEDPAQPKYLNSPDSALFSKRDLLYGLFENQRNIRLKSEAILVEGYMDVVGLYEGGVTNAIATMGTALTEEHCGRLKAFTKQVVTVFDPDSAGQQAWHRSVHIFLTSGLFARDLTLPEDLDPDEFIGKYGPEKFYELCEKAPSQIAKLLKEIASMGSLSETQRSKLVADFTPVLIASRHLPNRALLLDSLSLVLHVSVETLKAITKEAADKHRGPAAQSNKSAIQQDKASVSRKTPTEHPLDRLELEFLAAALRAPQDFLEFLPPNWEPVMREESILKILNILIQTPKESWPLVLQNVLQSNPPAAISSVLSEWLMNSELTTGQKTPHRAIFSELAKKMQNRKKELEIQKLSKQVRLNQNLGDEGDQLRLLERLNELRSRE